MRQKVKAGLANESLAQELHERYSYRMHDLSEYMKGFMQRFTQWFNRKHGHNGGLWEDAFKSVPVEDGVASRTMAAYIDLNPVRAGMRSSGARKLRGSAAAAAGVLWSVRDLQKGIG